MSEFPFPQNAAGEPTNLRRRVGWQYAVGVPARDEAMVDVISNAGPMTYGPGYLEQANILGSVERGAALPAAYNITTGPLDLGDIDPGSPGHLRILAAALNNIFGENVTGAHYRYRLGRAVAAIENSVVAPGPLTIWDNSDIGHPSRWIDVLVSGLTIAATSKQNLKLVANVVAGKFDLWGETAQTVGTGVGVDGLPKLRHNWAGNWAPEDFDASIFIKVIDAGAGTVKVKMGAAETYDGRTLTVTEGGWIYLYGTYDLSGAFADLGDYPVSATDGPLGRRDEQLMLYVGDITDWANDDEFEILQARTVWTPDFAIQRLIAETQCRFYLDGGEVAFDNGWTLTMGRQTAETRFAPGAGAQPIGSRVTGFQTVTVAVDRSLVDNDLATILMNRTPRPVVIEAIGDSLIGATTTPYGMLHVLPACRSEGAVYSVPAGGGDRVEQLTFSAGIPESDYSYGGLNFAGAYEIVVDTDDPNPLATGVGPVNTVLPGITGTATQGQTLTSSTGTWTGDALITFTRQWKRDGVAISGATGTTYLLVLADVGAIITVTVTASNAAGSAPATSAGTSAVASL